MAIFLIFDHDNTHVDPIKDQRGCYKRGDIVEVFDDSKPLVLPPAPPFVIVQVTGVTRAQALRFMESQYDSAVLENPILFRRRVWHLIWDLCPTSVKNALRNNRYYSTSLAQIRNYIQNKETGEYA